MLKKLKDILNAYTDTELEDMDLWVNSSCEIENILIDKYGIDLITDDIKIDLKEK